MSIHWVVNLYNARHRSPARLDLYFVDSLYLIKYVANSMPRVACVREPNAVASTASELTCQSQTRERPEL